MKWSEIESVNPFLETFWPEISLIEPVRAAIVRPDLGGSELGSLKYAVF
jgi:hypothetical protein